MAPVQSRGAGFFTFLLFVVILVVSGVPHALAQPVVELTAPGEVLIGETFDLQVAFSARATGYGPYVDLYLPRWGVDGPNNGPCDGVGFVAVDPGAPVAASPTVLPAPTCAPGPPVQRVHPFTGLSVNSCFDDYDLVVLELTFGNFEAVEPEVVFPVRLDVDGMADVRGTLAPLDCGADPDGSPLEIFASGGFRWGMDPQDNPQKDPPLPHVAPSCPLPTSASVTPRVMIAGATVEDPDSARPGSCFDGVDNGGDGDMDDEDSDCGGKTYLGPEDETATGPSFPQRYEITVDVADGQTVREVELVDELPAAMQFLRVTSVRLRGASGGPLKEGNPVQACGTGLDYLLTPPTPPGPGGDLAITFCSLTGTAEPDDAVVEFEFYVPQYDAGGGLVLDPETCEPAVLSNDIWAQGLWSPTDPRDRSPDTPGGELCVESDAAEVDHALAAKCVAIQKGVAVVEDNGHPGTTPGDRLRYTLAVQVSDYFDVGDLVVTDLLADGQTFLPNPAPRLVGDGDFQQPDTLEVDTSAPRCATELTFDLSQQLRDSGHPTGVVRGWAGGITFESRVDSAYRCGGTAGDASVDKHDPIRNGVDVDGWATWTEEDIETPARDDSGSELVIVSRPLEKSIHSIWRHGDNQPEVPPRSLQVSAGDTVTYRLRYELPTCDAEAMDVRDFLPKPVLDVSQPVFLGGSVPWQLTCAPYKGNSFLSATAQPGPDHSVPSLLDPQSCDGFTAQPAANSLTFQAGTFHGDDDGPCVLDLLYSLEATCEPFADGLFLTNRAIECEGNSFSHSPRLCQEARSEIRYAAPDLRLHKGAVAACCPFRRFIADPRLTPNLPGAGMQRIPGIKIGPGDRPTLPLLCGGDTGHFVPQPVGPVDFSQPGGDCPRFPAPLTSSGLEQQPLGSDLLGDVDPGTTVTFALVVENTGADPDGALDVEVQDVLPPGFEPTGRGAAGINLCVTDGAGNPLGYSGGDGQVLDGGVLTVALDDPGGSARPPGSLGPAAGPAGENLAVITYDLTVADLTVGSCASNGATITHYRSDACRENLATAGFGGPRSADAQVCRDPVAEKSVVTTSERHTASTGDPVELTIGEIVRYRLRLHLPEGTTNFLELVDSLPPGLAVLDPTASPPGTPPAIGVAVVADKAPNLPPGLEGAHQASFDPSAMLPLPADRISIGGDPRDGGQTLTLRFGSIGNRDRDCGRETLVVEFNALVLNADGNDHGVVGQNRYHAKIGKKHREKRIHAPPVEHRIVEPRLELAKRAAGPPDPAPGDIVQFVLTVTNPGEVTAFDAEVFDRLPDCLQWVPGSLRWRPYGGASGGTPSTSGNAISLAGLTVPPGGRALIAFSAQVTCPLRCGTENRASLEWTSLPRLGTPPGPGNATGSTTPGGSGAEDGERAADGPAGAVNDYRTEAEARVPGLCGCDPDLGLEKRCETAEGRFTRCTLDFHAASECAVTPPVTVVDDLPASLNLTAAQGAGWRCSPPGSDPVECEYSEELGPGEAPPPLVLDFAGDLGTDENCATLSSPGQVGPGNDTACTSDCPSDDPCVRYLVDDPAQCATLSAGCGPGETFFVDECGCGCRCAEEPELVMEKAMTDGFLDAAGLEVWEYTLGVTNRGGAATQGPIEVVDTLPPGLTLHSHSGSGWTCAQSPPGTMTCRHPGSPPLAPGGSLVVQVRLSPLDPTIPWQPVTGTVENCAAVNGAGSGDDGRACLSEYCPHPDDPASGLYGPYRETCDPEGRCDPAVCRELDPALCEEARGRHYFWNPCGCGCAPDPDLSLEKSFRRPAPKLPWVVTLEVVNEGLGRTTGPVEVVDVLPPGMTFRSASGAGWTCQAEPATASGQRVVCTYDGTVEMGDGTTLTLLVDGQPPRDVANCAEVSTPHDASPDNDRSCDGGPTVDPGTRPGLGSPTRLLAAPGEESCLCGLSEYGIAATEAPFLLDETRLLEVEPRGNGIHFKLPEDLETGRHRISRRGGPGGGLDLDVIRVDAELDQRRLLRGGSATLHLRVRGSEQPVAVRLTNSTPEIIRLEGGDEQVVTTSGGEVNTAAVTVRALRRGDFDLTWEALLSDCPCGEPAGE